MFISANPIFGQSCQQRIDLLKINLAFPGEESAVCLWCTQVYFSPPEEFLVSSKNSTIFWRTGKKAPFTAIPLDLSHPHSILYNPDDKFYYLNDTDNNRIIVYSSIQHGKIAKIITSIAGINLVRPHDIVHDPATGWIYTINPHTPTLFRFDHTGTRERSLDLADELGYCRALSIVNGRVYVTGSSSGRIVEILDFDNGRYRVYQSAGKKRPATSGNWETNGLIINDIDHFQGYWYVTSYFHPSVSGPLQDYNVNKFIRFQNWQDFESGEWQDLSSLLPDGLVPYYLNVQKDGLYIALFNHENPGHGDGVYKLSPYCPNLSATLLPLVN